MGGAPRRRSLRQDAFCRFTRPFPVAEPMTGPHPRVGTEGKTHPRSGLDPGHHPQSTPPSPSPRESLESTSGDRASANGVRGPWCASFRWEDSRMSPRRVSRVPTFPETDHLRISVSNFVSNYVTQHPRTFPLVPFLTVVRLYVDLRSTPSSGSGKSTQICPPLLEEVLDRSIVIL